MIKNKFSTVIGDINAFSRMSSQLLLCQDGLWGFLDLSTLIESISLNDEIILFDFDVQLSESTKHRCLHELLKPLINEGVIRIESYPENSSISNNPYDGNLPVLKIEDEPRIELIVEASNTAGAEIQYGCPGLLLTFHQPFYEANASVAEDHKICEVSGKYESFKKSLEKYRLNSSSSDARYRTLPIPPIANLAYTKCNSLSEVIESSLYIRKKFIKLRRLMSEQREILSDDSISPFIKMKQIRRWESSWKILNKKFNDSSIIQLADTNEFLLKSGDFLINGSTSPSSWSKLSLLMIEQFQSQFYKWSVRCLHSAGDKYIRTANNELNTHTRRILNIDANKEDINGIVTIMNDLNDYKNNYRILPYSKYLDL